MKLLTFAVIVCSLTTTVCANAAVQDEVVLLGESRKVSIAVPAGFDYALEKSDRGSFVAKFSAAKDELTLDIEFLPDPESQFTNARARKELLNDLFAELVGSSTEKAMQFEELDPSTGAGTYCAFTDEKLVGKTELPQGEYRHLTIGIKAWPGVLAVFRCFSNDITSPRYQSLLKMLRESVYEKPVPLK